MCGRKTLTRDMQSIIEELAIEEWYDDNFHPSFNIAPTQTSPILLGDGKSRIVKPMKWGLVPSWSKDESIGSKMINARSETLTEKPSFQNLINQNRCVVIADGYFEWKRKSDAANLFIFPIPKTNSCPWRAYGQPGNRPRAKLSIPILLLQHHHKKRLATSITACRSY